MRAWLLRIASETPTIPTHRTRRLPRCRLERHPAAAQLARRRRRPSRGLRPIASILSGSQRKVPHNSWVWRSWCWHGHRRARQASKACMPPQVASEQNCRRAPNGSAKTAFVARLRPHWSDPGGFSPQQRVQRRTGPLWQRLRRAPDESSRRRRHWQAWLRRRQLCSSVSTCRRHKRSSACLSPSLQCRWRLAPAARTPEILKSFPPCQQHHHSQRGRSYRYPRLLLPLATFHPGGQLRPIRPPCRLPRRYT